MESFFSQEAFKGRPRAIISLNLFNGFRLLCDKASNPQDRGREDVPPVDVPRSVCWRLEADTVDPFNQQKLARLGEMAFKEWTIKPTSTPTSWNTCLVSNPNRRFDSAVRHPNHRCVRTHLGPRLALKHAHLTTSFGSISRSRARLDSSART